MPTPRITKNVDHIHPVYIILGSGGHTAEMCQINKALLQSEQGAELYAPARYLVATSDSTSRQKIKLTLQEINHPVSEEAFLEVPRSREVGQSWLTSVFTTVWALLWSFWLIYRDCPRLILCNGPGTCVPFCVAAYVWRLLGRLPKDARIVFVESFCRVRSLSLSGLLLLPLVDALVVQWPALAHRYGDKKQVQYFGIIM